MAANFFADVEIEDYWNSHSFDKPSISTNALFAYIQSTINLGFLKSS